MLLLKLSEFHKALIMSKFNGVDGTIANVGVHGLPVQLDIDKLWIKNINVTTGLVSGNTTEELLEALKAK